MNPYKANIWKMYIFNFLTSLHFIGAVIVIFFTSWGQLSFTQVLFLQSWFAIWIFILEVPTGVIADYFGRKYSIALGALITGIGAIIYFSVSNFYIFLLAEFLWAMGCALESGANDALIYDSLKKTKDTKKSNKIFAKFETFKLMGYIASALLGSLIVAFFGVRYTMLFTGIPMIFAFFFAFTIKEPKTKIKRESKRYWLIFKEGAKYIFKHKPLWFLILDSVVIGVLIYYIIWVYQPLLQKQGFEIVLLGVVQALFVCSEMFFVNSYSKAENFFKQKKNLFFLIPLVVSLFYIVVAFFQQVWLIIIFVLVAGGLAHSKKTVLRSYMNKHIEDSGKRATILSAASMINRLSIAIINPFIGIYIYFAVNRNLWFNFHTFL